MPDFIRRIPDGDDRERLTCPDCGFVAYENPKIVVGSVVAEEGRTLLGRRAIEPRRGYWTLPAGYMELGETVEEGARREAWEEARARIALDGVLAVFSIARIGQVQVIFRARLAEPGFAAAAASCGRPLARDRPGWKRPGRESLAQQRLDPRRPDYSQADGGPAPARRSLVLGLVAWAVAGGGMDPAV